MVVKHYKTKCQGRCPQCNSEIISYETWEKVGDVVCYFFYCNECHYEGKEWYGLKYIETE